MSVFNIEEKITYRILNKIKGSKMDQKKPSTELR